MGTCKCGCGESVASRWVFVNKEHQLRWMASAVPPASDLAPAFRIP